MLGLMQDRPLLISQIIDYAAAAYPDVEIVTRTVEGPIHRYGYKDAHKRAKQLAEALQGLGIKLGDRVGTIAWNTYRHFELYFGISGIGAVLHTLNPRLAPEHVAYIANHAEDQIIFVDLNLVPIVEGVWDQLKTVKHVVVMTDRAHMPTSAKIPNLLCYEELIADRPGTLTWPEFDEKTASSLCYTSGTTGNPKGVLYSHRSTLLHSFTACASDGLKLSSADSVLLAVPLFHVNAWGIPYAAAMCGAKLVLPGPRLDGKSLFDLAVEENCNFSLGVPTVWLGLFKYLDETPGIDPSKLKLERVVIGGSAAPRAIIERFRRDHGVFVIHAWGMTETGPLSSIGNLLPKHRNLPVERQVDVQILQGRAIYGVELKIVDGDGKELPQDGSVAGDLLVRGPWVTSGYFKAEGGPSIDAEGWFATGDVAKIDADGYVQLTDRSKDVIKSGGEWISSIDLENAAMAHASVQEAAVIGLPHPRWQERPLLIVVRKPGVELGRQEILDFLSERVARWWLPDDVVFVDELPHTATGKLQKMKLREQFREHVLPQ